MKNQDKTTSPGRCRKPIIILSVVVIVLAAAMGAMYLNNAATEVSQSGEPHAEQPVLPNDALTISEKINAVLPEGAQIFANSGMGWYIRVEQDELAEAEKLVDYRLGGKGRYNGVLKETGVHVLGYTGRDLRVLIYAVDLGNEKTTSYLYVFDNNTEELLTYHDLRSQENENAVKWMCIYLEEFSKAKEKSAFYVMASQYLKREFEKVYLSRYEIHGLEITEWKESGNEAFCRFVMTNKNFDYDADKVDYIRKAKEEGDPHYEQLKEEYLALRKWDYDFKLTISEDGEIDLYYNEAAKGEDWKEIKVEDFVQE